MSIRIDGTNTTANPGITGSDTDTGLQFGTNEVKIVTDGSDRVTVDSSGNVGIATSTISGANLVIETNSNGGSGIKLIGKSANGGAEVDFRNNADDTLNGFIEFNDNGGILSTAINQPQVFRTNNTERMRILSGGGLTFNGDTAAVNALNDYEEGTFTPEWQTTGSAFTSVTYTDQIGYYTKIGNLVHVSIRLKSTASSGGGGYLLIGGLPYQIDDDTGAGGGSPSTYYIDYHNSTLNVATETRNDTRQFYLLSSTDNGGWSNVSASGIQGSGTSEVRVSFAYQTDS